MYTASTYSGDSKTTEKVRLYDLSVPKGEGLVLNFDPRFEEEGCKPNISKKLPNGTEIFALKLFVDNKNPKPGCPKIRMLFVMNKQF